MLRFTLYFIRDKIIHQIVIPHGSCHLFSPHELTVVLSLSCLSSLAFSLCFRTLSAIRSFRRFCKQFSESSPRLPGQLGSCIITLELSENIWHTLGNDLMTDSVHYVLSHQWHYWVLNSKVFGMIETLDRHLFSLGIWLWLLKWTVCKRLWQFILTASIGWSIFQSISNLNIIVTIACNVYIHILKA